MTANEIRSAYLTFMKNKGHEIVPSASLVPENDPTTLFTGSGMQPMLPYFMGKDHPKGARVADSQKCFRTEDIEEVGDNRHTTFFEMLGNWSFGDYFKEEQLSYIYTFLTETIQLDPTRLYITVFAGDDTNEIPKDEESVAIWKTLLEKTGVPNGVTYIGSEQDGYAKGMLDGDRIFYYDSSKNWWSRAGKPQSMPPGEPGGPDSEIFYDFGTPHDTSFGERCHPNCDCGRFVEICNSVFMEYLKEPNGTFSQLPQKNVDFGGGLERMVAAHLHSTKMIDDVFKTDFFTGIIAHLTSLSGHTYNDTSAQYSMRVIADHIRGAVFIIGDGVEPSNSEQGYILRRLIRRATRHADKLGVPPHHLMQLVDPIVTTYQETYPQLHAGKTHITNVVRQEEERFRLTLEKGMSRLQKILSQHLGGEEGSTREQLNGEDIFDLFTTYGFPAELTYEIAEEKGLKVSDNAKTLFNRLMDEHREKSRAGSTQKFKGGLADEGEKTIQYHTTTHLLLAGLRKILGDHVHQAGSNITNERLRFDFTHGEKMTPEQIHAVEDYVNTALHTGGEVTIEKMPKDKAEADPSIEGSFWDRYPDEVYVYTVNGKDGTIYSRELCGGPHVSSISEIQGTFVIKKEESSSAGVRRIKAILE